jgi:hypothetical protein
MAVIETIEGMVAGALWFHYDAGGDVLYLRLADRREAEAVGEETDDGFILLREMTTNETVGLTVVNWWKRFGQGEFPDSLREIQARIEPWARKVAA